MSTELESEFLDGTVNDPVRNEAITSSPFRRQDLSGGSGVFANFFEEMAEPIATENKFFQEKACTQNSYYNQCGRNTDYLDEDPMHAFYAFNADDDLKFLEQYQIFLGQNAECDYQPEYSVADTSMTHSSLLHYGTEFSRVDPNNSLCISYVHRNKPPKVLANRFLLGATIGRGSYGKVKDAIDLLTLRRHAVKIISKLGVRKIPNGWNQALLEAGLLRRLSACRNIVSLVAVLRLTSPDRLCLVMEHCLGSVHDLQAVGVPSLSIETFDNELVDDMSRLDCSSKRNKTKPRCSVVQRVDQGHVQEFTRLNRKISDVEHPANRSSKPSSSQQQQQQQQQFRRLSEAQAHAYFLQIINALHYLHCNGIIHRDIKPANLLLTPAPGCGLSESGNPDGTVDLPNYDWTSTSGRGESGLGGRSFSDVLAASRGWLIKLTDFGVSASLSPYSRSSLVNCSQTTPAVQPPEVAKGVQSMFDGPKLDVYSAGVTLYIMLTGRVPFSCQNVLQIFEAIVDGQYTIPGYVSTNAANLIRKMMHKNLKERLTLDEICEQPWFVHNPPQPLSMEVVRAQLREKLASNLDKNQAETKYSSGNSDNLITQCGTICWLDPLVYLRRPLPEFEAPHIDENGARIFTANELFEQDVGSGDEVAPFSVNDLWKIFYVLHGEENERKQYTTHDTHSPSHLWHNGTVLDSRLADMDLSPGCHADMVSKFYPDECIDSINVSTVIGLRKNRPIDNDDDDNDYTGSIHRLRFHSGGPSTLSQHHMSALSRNQHRVSLPLCAQDRHVAAYDFPPPHPTDLPVSWPSRKAAPHIAFYPQPLHTDKETDEPNCTDSRQFTDVIVFNSNPDQNCWRHSAGTLNDHPTDDSINEAGKRQTKNGKRSDKKQSCSPITHSSRHANRLSKWFSNSFAQLRYWCVRNLKQQSDGSSKQHKASKIRNMGSTYSEPLLNTLIKPESVSNQRTIFKS